MADMNLYQKNMTVLHGCAPKTALWVHAARPDSRFQVIPEEPGPPNLAVRTDNGSFLLYSDQSPNGSPPLPASLPMAEGCSVTVLFGFGLGRTAAAMLAAGSPGHVLMVVEEHPFLIQAALRTRDLTSPLAADALMFVPPEEHLLRRLAADLAPAYRNGEARVVVDENAARLFSPAFRRQVDRFQRLLEGQARDLGAVARDSALVVENEIRNLPLTLSSPGIAPLQGALRNRAALVVSAGPSLIQAAPLLNEAAGRAAIIATAPVLRVLLAHDVIPDLVGVLDYTPSNHDVFRDVYATEDAPLVFLEAVHPSVIREYLGDLISVFHSHGPVWNWLAPRLPGRAHWPVGRNVGSFCLDLALYLDADPIILAGQDLSYPDHSSHAEGVIGRRTSLAETSTREPVWLESVTGGRVLSSGLLASYLDEFEETIRRHPGRTFINTSPDGARIRGTIEMPLAQALARYAGESAPPPPSLRPASSPAPENLSGAWAELEALDGELDHLAVVAAKVREFEDEISGLLDSAESPASGRLGHLIRVHADYLAKTRAYFNVFTPLKSYLVSPLCLAPNLDHWAVRGRDWKAGIARIVDRSRQVMAPAREGALKLKEWLKSARDEMSAAGLGPEDTEADTNAQTPEPSDPLPRIQALRRLGRVRTAWTHLRAALALAPDNPDLLMEAARIVFMRERVRAAEELAAEVEARRPGRPDARRLRKDIAATLVDWEKRARLALERDDWITTLLLTRKIRAARPDHQPALDLEQAALARRAEREREAKADRSFTTANAPSPPHPAPVETIIQAAPPAISDSAEASRPSVVKHHGAG